MTVRTRAPKPAANTAWIDSAACRNADASLFFPSDGERILERENRELKAKAVCARCIVRHVCLNTAIEQNEKVGVWGGLNEEERISERRRQRRASAA